MRGDYRTPEQCIRKCIGDRPPTACVVLGTGHEHIINELCRVPGSNAVTMAYGDIRFPLATSDNVRNQLVCVTLGGRTVYVLGSTPQTRGAVALEAMFLGLRTVVGMGASTAVLINCAGSITTDYHIGDLVLVNDHVDLSDTRGFMAGCTFYPPGGLDLVSMYPHGLRATAALVLRGAGKFGVYACLSRAPGCETPAEIAMLRRAGGHIVGSSFIPTAMAATAMGASVLGICLVTNVASPHRQGHVLTQEMILKAARSSSERLAAFLVDFFGQLPVDNKAAPAI